MTVVVAGTFVIADGQEGNAERLLRECALLSRAESGVRSYDVYRDTRNPRQFFVVEVFRDDEAMDAHRNSEHVKRLIIDQLMSLTESFEIAQYSPIEIAT